MEDLRPVLALVSALVCGVILIIASGVADANENGYFFTSTFDGVPDRVFLCYSKTNTPTPEDYKTCTDAGLIFEMVRDTANKIMLEGAI